MADAAQIAEVQDLLPSDQTEWDEAKITTYLDAGKSIPEVMTLFYEKRAANYSEAIDVNESGSVRSLSKLYDNAIRLAEYWRDRAQKDKDDAEKEENGRLRFNRITRV